MDKSVSECNCSCDAYGELKKEIIKLQNDSFENQSKLHNTCFALMTLRNDFSLIENKIVEEAFKHIQNFQLKHMADLVKEEVNKQKDIFLGNFEKEKKEWQTQIDNNEKRTWKEVREEIKSLETKIEHQRDTLKSLELNYFTEIMNMKHTVNQMQAKISKTDDLNMKLNIFLQDSECNFDDFQSRMSIKLHEFEEQQSIFIRDIENIKTKLVEVVVLPQDIRNVTEISRHKQDLSDEMDVLQNDTKEEFSSNSTPLDMINELDKLQNENEASFTKFQNSSAKIEKIHKELKISINDILDKIKCLELDTAVIKNQIDGLYSHHSSTPLHMACKKESKFECIHLLKEGASLNVFNRIGFTPLHYTVENCDGETLKTLLSYKPNVNCQTKCGSTPLVIASSKNNEILKDLLQAGANPNIPVKDGLTALHFATVHNNLTFVKTLLNYNADVNIAVNGTITPLCIATYLHHNEIVELLQNGSEGDPSKIINNCQELIDNLLNILKHINENYYLKIFSLYVLYGLYQINDNRDIISQSQVIPILLKCIDYGLKHPNGNEILQIIWDIMAGLIELSPDNCNILVNNNCLDYALKCLPNILEDKIYLPYLLTTMANIAEVKTHRCYLMNEIFISRLIQIVNVKNLTTNIVRIIKLLCHLLAEGPDAWIMHKPTYYDVLNLIETCIDKMSFSLSLSCSFPSLDFIFEFLTYQNIYQVQLFGAWAIANLLTVFPIKSYPLVQKLNGLDKLIMLAHSSEIHYKVMNLINDAINKYNIYDQKHPNI